MNNENFDIDDIIKDLSVDINSGLSESEIQERIKKYGYNSIEEKKESNLIKFLRKFKSFTSIMLEFITILYIIFGKIEDAIIVISLLIINAVISFIHEERANKALELLKEKLQIQARVLREGKWKLIESKYLVPGDIIRLRAGDISPADCIILSNDILNIDQSMLTGESITVDKTKGNIIYSGSIIKRGESNCIVYKTGKNTYFGKTIELVSTAKPKLHIEEITSSVVKNLLLITGFFSSIVLIISFLYYHSLLYILSNIVPLVISLLLFAVPVALPVMITVTLSLGSLELIKSNVLVTRLSSIEDAASMTTLCSDKTGTLTYNKLTVTDIYPLNNYNINDVILYGSLASEISNNDPIDLAFINKLKELNINKDNYNILEFKPFDPSTRRTEAKVSYNNDVLYVSKGAVNTIFNELCKENVPGDIQKIIDNYASKGYRTLAVAINNNNNKWIPVGLVALYDIPRKDTPELIKKLKELGIKVKMLTGDALPIAKEIGNSIGLDPNKVVSGNELRNLLKENPGKVSNLVNNSEIFAEIYPEDKYYIVKSLQDKKEIVGMTGDGVNDSPSLKQAEVGIAVYNATDVAKSAASVVLTVEGLQGIVDLIKIGRSVYQRIVTWILLKINRVIEISLLVMIVFIFTEIILHQPILLVSSEGAILFFFLKDFPTIAIGTDNVKPSQYPESWDIRKLVLYSGILSLFSFMEELFLFIFYYFYLDIRSIAYLQSLFFLSIMYFGLLMLFVFRESDRFYKSRPSNLLLISTIIDILASTIIGIFGFGIIEPIKIIDIIFISIYSLFSIFVINDSIKILLNRTKIAIK
ncbi:copper-exporting P-type ATPase B [Nanobdella aerobiophila]|uniref:Copper-exporting P-type ATPase B n=1 Tax=Nanobdella aerobiophila TaxID=2586965 RepID=A0A915SFI5_9ARCH|nr:plasma-membrane proton-efflux P-type ATPase [Nanobdella aerobiophila]BBL45419.1 copper-exporting P-type ATPase B [Nanobdella aerobiophila]